MAVLEVLIDVSATNSLMVRRALRVYQPGQHVYLFTLRLPRFWRSPTSRVSAAEARVSDRLPARYVVRATFGRSSSTWTVTRSCSPTRSILALPSTIKFITSSGPERLRRPTRKPAHLEIPTSPNRRRPAWIVDGQQRALALVPLLAHPRPAGPHHRVRCRRVALQRDQFVRINNIRPLPRGLVTEFSLASARTR